MDVSGRTAVITGAASGIGRATAVAFAGEGVDLVLADVNEERLAEAKAEIAALGRKAVTVKTDVSKVADVQALFDRALAEMGRVDILMNNAGVHMMGRLDKIPLADWEWLLGINLWGVIYGVHVFLPHMLERGSGHIINTGSHAGLVPSDAAPYTVAKYGVVGLSEVMAIFLKNRGIGVTVVCPGLVATNIVEGARFVESGDDTDAVRRMMYDAFKRRDWEAAAAFQAEVIEPERVAELVVDAVKTGKFLVTPHAMTREMVRERGEDIEAYIAKRAAEVGEREQMMRALAAAMKEQQEQGQ